MSRRSGAIALLLFLAATPRAGSGQSALAAEVDTTRITVGDRIAMTVSIEHPASAEATLSDSLSLDPFEVLEVRALPPQSTGEVVRSSWVLTLTAFELGELTIPPVPVEVREADGSVETAETDRFGVEVVSVGSDESGDIREIRGPLGIPVASWVLLLWVLVPLILAALIYMWVRRLGRAGEDVARPALGPPPRPAYEVALEALAKLEASPLLERGEIKEYHIELSDILRTYVEERFRVDALEMTTREVLDGLGRVGADAAFRVGLRTVLEACDLVKFAKARPSVEVSRETLEMGRRIVRESVRDLAPAAEAVGAGGGP